MKVKREPEERLNALTGQVIGAAIEVHRALGPGYLESIYEAAMSIELTERGIPYVCQYPFEVRYKGSIVGNGRLDLHVAGVLVVELKAVDKIVDIHRAQTLSYLKAASCMPGLILNFKSPVLKDGIERIVLS